MLFKTANGFFAFGRIFMHGPVPEIVHKHKHFSLLAGTKENGQPVLTKHTLAYFFVKNSIPL
jgi:hypothetical protein